MMDAVTDDVLGLTVQIVTAYDGKNQVALDELTALIRAVYRALTTAEAIEAKPAGINRPRAVALKKSVFPDYIVCLEDGKQLTMLKRHLMARYGMTPDQYRTKWGLPLDYPMTAPTYASRRSAIAKKSGFGRETPVKPSVGREPPILVLPARRARGSRG